MTKKPNTKKRQSTSDSDGGVVTGATYPSEEVKWWREAVEGLVIAIVLALLIRGFEAEAFVIPTGSMAPALRGGHKDVTCEQCGHNYAAGAAFDREVMAGRVETTICPLCSYPRELTYETAMDKSHTGDRILVNKFAYGLMGDPERFDVIVFKNPGNAKQNYIKRLCGLPGETIRLFRGDIYYKKEGDADFTIARKPNAKIKSLLHLVHDTDHVPAALDKEGLPPRWQPMPGAAGWASDDNNRSFRLEPSNTESWIRYTHIAADIFDWEEFKNNGSMPQLPAKTGQLITDQYCYNAYRHASEKTPSPNDAYYSNYMVRSIGKNWVGDLAVEFDGTVAGSNGTVLLDLVEGGWHFRCSIDVATGKATCDINGGNNPFTNSKVVSAPTNVRGPGKHRFFFTNVDSELRLWVDGKFCKFDNAATYDRADNDTFRPVYSGPTDPCDLSPIGIGGLNVGLEVNRLRIHRDVYYVAVRVHNPESPDYGTNGLGDVLHAFASPETWATTNTFDELRSETFVLKDSENDAEDQFFPMGDNSPHSEDARIWGAPPYVERQFLIGEAMVIYWPHPWHAKISGNSSNYRTIPIFPNVTRMGVIH